MGLKMCLPIVKMHCRGPLPTNPFLLPSMLGGSTSSSTRVVCLREVVAAIWTTE
ncbi:hypothetical protein Gotur_023728 [Gossypium turneri]